MEFNEKVHSMVMDYYDEDPLSHKAILKIKLNRAEEEFNEAMRYMEFSAPQRIAIIKNYKVLLHQYKHYNELFPEELI